MAETLTLPTDEIQAVLQDCSGISPLEREGIMARLKTRDVTPARPELTSTYVLVNEETSYTMPEPTAHHGFNLFKWCGMTSLPYELQEEITIPHMVVVVSHTIYAMKFVDLLKSQKGLEIGALEILILANLEEEEGFLEPSMAKEELEGTALMNWAGSSKSIKIVEEKTTVEKELERHVRFVVNRNSLRSLRSLTDRDRAEDDRIMGDTQNPSVDQVQAVLHTSPAISPIERDGIVTRITAHDVTPAPVVRPEMGITYVFANVKAPCTMPDIPNHGFDLLKWRVGNSLPYQLRQKTSIPHLVVVTGRPRYAMTSFALLKSHKGLEIGALEFLILTNRKNVQRDYLNLPMAKKELEESPLLRWAGRSNSIKIIAEETTVEAQLEQHARSVLNHNGDRNLQGLGAEHRDGDYKY